MTWMIWGTPILLDTSICQWPFQEPKLEVPTIYKAHFSGLFQGISPQNMANNMVLTYLHFRILKISHWIWDELHVDEAAASTSPWRVTQCAWPRRPETGGQLWSSWRPCAAWRKSADGEGERQQTDGENYGNWWDIICMYIYIYLGKL